MNFISQAILPVILLYSFAFVQYQGAAFAQENPRFVNKGLLRAQGNVSSGVMLKSPGTNIYIHGDLEYYFEPNISIRSESYYFLGTYNSGPTFAMNHSNFAGVMYHFPAHGKFDPYIGIQPGIALSQLAKPVLLAADSAQWSPYSVSSYSTAFSPLFSASAGFNYYAYKFFNLFIHVKYVAGKHLSDIQPESLSELKMTFGLGWNIWVIRKNKTTAE
jgi:hypothetical protein